MNRLWDRETLRFVDAWACRQGAPEDDEEAVNAVDSREKYGSNLTGVKVSEAEGATV